MVWVVRMASRCCGLRKELGVYVRCVLQGFDFEIYSTDLLRL